MFSEGVRDWGGISGVEFFPGPRDWGGIFQKFPPRFSEITDLKMFEQISKHSAVVHQARTPILWGIVRWYYAQILLKSYRN